MAWVSQAQLKRRTITRSVLEAELEALKTTTVNDHSPALLSDAAPDTYEALRRYLTRRIASLD